ncbi:MAG: hypothetical protein QOE40_2622, partial [Actinomycetota bacterium]|nr:hypothetical protein [Actinomycetota bacterium]
MTALERPIWTQWIGVRLELADYLSDAS